MTEYAATSYVPPLVGQAVRLAKQSGFEQSCLPEVGRLLRVLALGRGGTLGEIGAGCGVGSAWIASGLSPSASFVTVELDSARAERVSELLGNLPNVKVLQGDWRDILRYAPFSLLFVDAKPAKLEYAGDIVRAMSPGGLVVLDDFTPEEQWPPEWQGKPDPVRDFWLNDPRLAAIEIGVTASSSLILAVRL